MAAAILSILGPIFVLIALGYGSVRSGYVEQATVQGIGAFVLRIAMPALILGALIGAPLEATLDRPFLIAYGAGSAAVFAFGYLRARFLAGQRGPVAAMQALGMSCSNSGFMGYPIAAMLLGPVAAATLAKCMIVENLLIIPAALILAELGRGGEGHPLRAATAVAGRLARNPLLVAIAAGIALAALDAALPTWIERSVELLGRTSAPAALFVVGGTLAALPGGGLGDTFWVVLGKLILHPLAVLGLMLLMPGGDPMRLAAALVFASVPMITIYPIIGGQFGQARPCAAALFAATLCAAFTLPLMLAGLDLAGLLELPR
jgi:malonate transporter and related proteins